MPPHNQQPADQAQRDAAIRERSRNVLIDAGAGTGKTTLLADRLVEMVASHGDAAPVPIERLAAITFTRKAAGELKLRVRERLLSALAGCAPQDARAGLLRAALAGLDTAHISTIHSFCDRLLRLRPVEAQLSPSFEIAEEADALVAETFSLLLDSAQAGRLAPLLAGTAAADFAEEAQATLLDAIAVGLRRDTHELEFYAYTGLDELVRQFILQRDVPFVLPAAEPFDGELFRTRAAEVISRAKAAASVGEGIGTAWLRQLRRALESLAREDDPVTIWADLGRLPRGPNGKPKAQLKKDFPDDAQGWSFWKWYGEAKSETLFREQLLAPLHRWMALRLVRLFPAVIALYDLVKSRRRQLDNIDLLVQLRDLLARDTGVRGHFQSLFDHLFVDEFQDTDPLQAEIVFFLCERAPQANRWHEAKLAPGKLTLVGDPKQSIYRFRRADIAVYEQVRELVGASKCLKITLSANFRSAVPLIEWVNQRFRHILGEQQPGEPLFDAGTGSVRYQPLEPGPSAKRDGPRVHALPIRFAEGEDDKIDAFRAREGEALARYLRHLVDSGSMHIADPVDGQERALRYGDVAVLALSTWQLRMLFPSFERFGVPFAARGGRLLLEDPLHQQLLLALRAIADRDDGPAQVALFRPPFFAVDLTDLLHERGQAAAERGEPLPGTVDADKARRAREAIEVVVDLRRRRLLRPVGATARDLLERTAFGRALATGPNGQQRLDRAHEVIRAVESLATAEGLDYDGATARARDWIESPVQLDPPHPVGDEAVQVLTIHQAKGLEFPVVVLWDAKAAWPARAEGGAFRVARDGSAWSLDLDGLSWEEPEGADIAQREKAFRDAERKRAAYVAATRARDHFISAIPEEADPARQIGAGLLDDETGTLVEQLAPYGGDDARGWLNEVAPAPEVPVAPLRGKALKEEQAAEAGLAQRWSAALAASERPHLVPTSVTKLAHAVDEAAWVRMRAAAEDGAPEQSPRRRRESRYGNRFGDAVHRAIGHYLRDSRLSAAEAVERAARVAGLGEHLDEAAEDVARTLATLRAEQLTGPDARLEYPVWSSADGPELVQGFIDLLALSEGALVVVDFKTDAPPAADVEAEHPAYVAQVRAYRDLLEAAGVRGAAPTRCALLFTADGAMRWC